MGNLDTQAAFGLTLPTPAYLAGSIVFGLIGFAAYRYGKRMSRGKVQWLGVALMLYPYLISGTRLLYLFGLVLCLGLYIWRE